MRTRICLSILTLALFGGSTPGQTGASAPRPTRIWVQLRSLNGEPVAHLNESDFVLTTQGHRLAIRTTQPSLSHRSDAGLPRLRVLIIFPYSSGFRSAAQVDAWLQQNFTYPLGDAELAAMLPDGTASPFLHTVAELRASLTQSTFTPAHGLAAFDQLAAFPGRRAVIYIGGPYQSIPPSLLKAALTAGALSYELGADPFQDLQFTNQASPAGPPAFGGSASLNPSFPPYIGIAAVSSGYIPGARAVSLDSPQKELSLRGILRDIQHDGSGFYQLTINSTLPDSELTLSLKYLENYLISAEIEHSGAVPPRLVLAHSA